MEKLKEHQLAMTIDEQIQNLKDIGLIIDDEEYARKILNEISCFRLIKAYSLNLKGKNGCYYKGITFEYIVGLYLFNTDFRKILFAQIERIEVSTRCRIANYFAEKQYAVGFIR